MGLAVQYHVLSHRFRRGAELDGFCGNEIEETDGSCRELRGGRGDSGRRRCQTRGASRHAGGSGDGPARAGGPRRAGVAGLRERKSPAVADRSCRSQKSQRAVAGGGAHPADEPRGSEGSEGRSPRRREARQTLLSPGLLFRLFVLCFLILAISGHCELHTQLSLSLSPHPRPCPGGHASQQGNPPCPPPERQSRPSRVDGVPCGNGERGPRRGWSSLSLSQDPGRTGLGDRAGAGRRLGRPPGAAGCPPVPAVSVGTEPRGLGWGRGAASGAPGCPGRRASRQRLHSASTPPAHDLQPRLVPGVTPFSLLGCSLSLG